MQQQREQSPAPVVTDAIPACGFRARRWARFENDLDAWLATPQGGFAQWRAARAVAAPTVERTG